MVSKKKTMNEQYIEETKRDISNGIIPVVKKTIEYYEKYVFPEAIEIMKHDQWDASDHYATLQWLFWQDAKYRSCTTFPLIPQMVDTFVANLYDTETKTRAVAFDEKDQEDTEMAQDFYDWAYDVSCAEDVKEVLKREAVLLWTSYAIARYDMTEQEMFYKKDWELKSTWKTIKSKPIVENMSFFSLFLPPNTKDFYKAKRYAYRYIETKDNIKKRYSNLWISDRDDKDFMWAPLSTYDYDRVYDIKSYWSNLIKRIQCWSLQINWSADFINKNLFEIDFKDNEYAEVIEFHEWDNVTVIINWKQKYSDFSWNVAWAPFLCLTYDRHPWTFFWRRVWYKLLPFQREAIQITNCIKDVTNQWLYPSFTAVKWSIRDSAWRTPATMYWIPWKVYELTQNIWNWWLSPIEFANPNYIGAWQNRIVWLLNQAQEVIWINSYLTWWQQKVERSSAWVQQRIAVMRARLQPIISSLNRFDSHLFWHRLAQATVFMDNQFKARIVWDDWSVRWSKIKVSDILNKFDIITDNEATRALTKNLRATQALDALNKLYQINVDPITQMPIYDLSGALEYVAENFDFPLLKKYTPEQLQEKVDTKMQFQEILSQQQTPQTNNWQQQIDLQSLLQQTQWDNGLVDQQIDQQEPSWLWYVW